MVHGFLLFSSTERRHVVRECNLRHAIVALPCTKGTADDTLTLWLWTIYESLLKRGSIPTTSQ